MKSVQKLSLALAMCLVILMPHQIAGEEVKGEELAKKVCEKTPSQEVCMRNLKADPRSQTGRLEDMAMVSLKAAQDNASDIINHLKKLVVNDSLGPEIQQGMSDCLDTLTDASEQLQTSVASLLTKHTKDPQRYLQAAVDAVDTCRASVEGGDALLLDTDDNFRLLCEIALSVCKTLDNGI